ncbi:MAG: tetratricopeptide repeat protein, partial [Alphaproteobacteria bacterium]
SSCNGGATGGSQGDDGGSQRRPGVIEPVENRSPFGSFLSGRFAERQRDFARAAASLNRALEEQPENLGLKRRAFYVSLRSGRTDTALTLAKELNEANLGVSTAQLLLAAQSVKEGDFPAAISILDAMERNEIARYAVPLALAWARAGANNTRGALAALAALDESTGFGPLRRMHEGLINDLAENNQAAERSYRESLGGDPGSAPVRVVRTLGGFLERAGRKDEAEALYRGYRGRDFDGLLFEADLARVAEGSIPERVIADSRAGMAESFFDIASVLPKERAGEIVLLYVHLALYLKPDFPLAQVLLGEVLDSYERFGEAVEIYRNINPDSPYGWIARLRMADDLYDLGKVNAAATVLRGMGRERPERSDALIRLGNIMRYEERYGEAITVYDQAVERLGTVERNNWSLLYSRGIALERAGKWERAEQDFLHALELEPDQPYVLNYLGYSWVEKGINLQRAKKMLESAVAQRQDDGYIIDSMGWALYQLKEYREAVSHLERAVELLPQDPVLNVHLGDAYWRVGRAGEARIQWRRVLGLDPEADLEKSAGKKLKRGLPNPGTAG